MDNERLSYRIIKRNVCKPVDYRYDYLNQSKTISTNMKMTPIRTSTLKVALAEHMDNQYSSYPVIRRQFPTTSKVLSKKKPEFLDTYSDNSSDSSNFPSDISSNISSEESLSLKSDISIGQKRRADDSTRYESGDKIRPIETCKRPRIVPMGAGIKCHPRYKKISFDTNKPAKGSLAPICSIPLPSMFSYLPPPDKLPSKISVETQTSPLSVTETRQTSRIDKQESRRNSGANMLNNLKKTFGNIRRAMSAERLNQVGSESPHEANQMHTDRVSPATINSCRRVLVSPMKFRRSRQYQRSPKCNGTSNGASRKLTFKQAQDVGFKWTLEHRFKDSSYIVKMTRDHVKIPFGFSIARDSDGIFISRLGNVRSVVAYWNLFQVGDRVIKVQNIDCTNWDVSQVQSTIGNELSVIFHIKPAHTNR